MILQVEASGRPIDKEFSKILSLSRIPVFREPFNMFQEAGYVLTPKLEKYILSLFGHLMSSLSLEDLGGFACLRVFLRLGLSERQG